MISSLGLVLSNMSKNLKNEKVQTDNFACCFVL